MKNAYLSSNRIAAGIFTVLSVLAATSCSPGKKHVITLESELQNLTQTSSIASPPVGTAHLVSSYDRRGGNRDWGDYAQNTPVGDGLAIVATIDGPGCISRIWMTGQNPAKWNIFIDGEQEPRIANLKPNQPGALSRSPLIQPLWNEASNGYTCYLPIPFEKSIQFMVPVDYRPRSPYYQINYQRYSKRAKVVSFPKQLSNEQLKLIEQTASSWSNQKALQKAALEQTTWDIKNKQLPAGETLTLFQSDREGTVQSFWIAPEFDKTLPEKTNDQFLRGLRLQIFWDHLKEPSINVPFGDFFCNGLKRRRFNSIAVSKIDGKYLCNLPMPFHTGARIVLLNESNHSLGFQFGINASFNAPQRDAPLLHAEWRQTSAMTTPPGQPHRLLKTEGRGHFIGCYLNAKGNDGSWNILEGDEKFYIDGELTPTLHGTGLEDYFNGAWYYSGLSDLPLSGLLEKAAMCTDQYRFHVNERIKFNTKLSANIEFGHVMGSPQGPNSIPGYISSTAFWYQYPPTGVAQVPNAAKRLAPDTRFENALMMAELIELEREKLWEEAQQRTRRIKEKHGNNEIAQLAGLRILHYEELLGHKEKAIKGYRHMLSNQPGPAIAQHLEQLLAYHDQPDQAFIWVNASSPFKLFLDGELLLEGTDPQVLYSRIAVLPKGPHVLTAEAVKTTSFPWFGATLLTPTQRIDMGPEWKWTTSRPVNWPGLTSGDSSAWADSSYQIHSYRPKMQNWIFHMNPFADSMTGPIAFQEFKHVESNQPLYFKREFSSP